MRDTLPSIPTGDLPESTHASDKPPHGTNGELPQFPGVTFGEQAIDLADGEATENDAAIRASLVYFKHRWPGQAAVIEGSDAFRLRAWAIADEIGVPLKGPRPGSGKLATRLG